MPGQVVRRPVLLDPRNDRGTGGPHCPRACTRPRSSRLRDVAQALAQRRKLDSHLRNAKVRVATGSDPAAFISAAMSLRRSRRGRGRRWARRRFPPTRLTCRSRRARRSFGWRSSGSSPSSSRKSVPPSASGGRALSPLVPAPVKSPLLVPEQDARRERRRDASAVDDDERLLRARGSPRESRLGTHLLAGPRLAQDEDRQGRRGDSLEDAEHASHPRASSDEHPEAVGPQPTSTWCSACSARPAAASYGQPTVTEVGDARRPRVAHPEGADVRAVGAAEVPDEDAVAHRAELAVGHAHLGIVDDDVSPRFPAHDDGVHVDGVRLAVRRPGGPSADHPVHLALPGRLVRFQGLHATSARRGAGRL